MLRIGAGNQQEQTLITDCGNAIAMHEKGSPCGVTLRDLFLTVHCRVHHRVLRCEVK